MSLDTDRGDDFTPTGADADTATAVDTAVADKAAADAAAAKLEADLAGDKDDKADDADKAEDKAEDKDEPAKAKADKKDTRIPLARHEALLTKERDARAVLEAQLAQFQQGGKVADLNAELTAAETRLLAMEKDYAKLLTDGEPDKAADIMRDIRRLEREMSESKSDMKIAAAEARATERARYNISLERIEQAYPALNPDHDDFDAELLTDVADLKTTYERKGMTPAAALQKAVAKLAGADTKKQETAVEVTPQVDKDAVAKAVAAERKKDAVAKTLDAAGKTPPSTAKVGMDSDKAGGSITAKDVVKMSHKDFSALSDEVLAKMRGDHL